MDANQFQADLSNLLNEIGALPTPEQANLDAAARARAQGENLKQTVTDLRDSVDYLRLAVKYLLFDLEATRRENDYLRQMLTEEPEI